MAFGRLGAGFGRLGRRGASSGYDPVTELGSDLVELWDASRYDLMTDDGAGVISSWAGSKNGYAATAATTARPTYSATSFNGGPGVTFDGSANAMVCTTAGLLSALPDGAEACELWACCQQDAAGADATLRYVFSYGAAAGTLRAIGRASVSSVGRARVTVGDGATGQLRNETTVDMSSRHVVRAQIGATETTLTIDGVAASALSVVPSTTATRLRLGASPLSSASQFWNGKIRVAAVTLPLSAQKATGFAAYLDGLT